MSVRRTIHIIALILLVMSLAACSPAPLPPAPAPPTAAPPAPTEAPAEPTPAPSPAADDWARVQAAGVLRVGSSLDNPPFNDYNADFQPDGFEVALMDAIAGQLGLKVEYDDFAFDGLLNALQLDRIDAVIASMAITDQRKEVADFTRSYYQGEDIVLAAAGSPITAIAGAEDLAQHKLGVQRGTIYESWLLKNLVGAGKMPPTNLRAYSQPSDALGALDKGQVDLVVMDRVPGLVVVSEGKAKEVGKSLYTQDYAIALRRASTLAPRLNQALARLQADGTMTKLAEQYLGITPDQFTPVPSPTAEPQPVATVTPAPTPTPAPMDDMDYVDDLSYKDSKTSVPTVQPGQAFKKGWRIRNTGTTTWTPDYRLAYASGNTPASAMDGKPVLVGQSVAPGQEIDIWVDLVAPQSPGVYQGFWEMKTAANKAFGKQIWVKVQVPAPPPTVTPTPRPGLKADFWADQTSLSAGATTTLHWRVSGSQAVQFCEPQQSCRGVAFSADVYITPPVGTSTYELRVQRADGGWESRYVNMQVAQPANTATITSFNADPQGINPGGAVNLWWTVQGAAGRMALLRDRGLIADYVPGTSYRDQPPGSNVMVVYELQVWPAGRDTGEPDKRQVAISIAGSAPPPPQTVQLYKDSCMSYQTLRAGDTLRVTLEAQSGTGFVWYESPDYNGGVLMGSGSPQVGGGGAPGAPESYTFSYTAGPGQTTLTLLYGRQGEGAEAAIEACAITVTVQ